MPRATSKLGQHLGQARFFRQRRGCGVIRLSQRPALARKTAR